MFGRFLSTQIILKMPQAVDAGEKYLGKAYSVKTNRVFLLHLAPHLQRSVGPALSYWPFSSRSRCHSPIKCGYENCSWKLQARWKEGGDSTVSLRWTPRAAKSISTSYRKSNHFGPDASQIPGLKVNFPPFWNPENCLIIGTYSDIVR